MHKFDKISIQEISKEDMLMILKALDYTGKNTNTKDYLILKNDIIKELSILTETCEEEFIEYLKK